MEVKVDKDACISCGLCVNNAPAVFEWDGDKATAIEGQVPEKVEADVQGSLEGCPTDAIKEV
ncbi:ferredoxin [Halanaerobaculum tunisiense]